MKDKINGIIFSILKDLSEDLENENLKNPTMQTKIYGVEGNLDSLALVGLVSDLESIIADEFGVDLVLASDKTMSQKNSPFKDVESLSNYILALMEKNNA
ncbi:hypothetical protein ACL9FO_001493 [Campylobacter coli]|uniref:hypothetical protein n=1 Tax=Campylobacter coli TaxID=195 RepID=UPI0002582A4C|nr:hypothetical protein [Campylobacter coli]EAH4677184.1 hypothetical protein [Campylobacter jejuni]AOH49469.1 hypothetical protein CC14983A_0336 [Campylobacter coli]AUG27532.1 hypothetical protein CXQ83_07115 [Campylobacter coli]EAC1269031.1 hypothetical protein [Campylobacter coli]EAH4687269.1 hypothetical protein [Campylobacter jejuni]